MARVKLTDRYIKSLKASEDGKPYEVMDTVVDRMGIRVMGTSDNPVRTFVLIARFQVGKSPTRRALGTYIEPPAVAPEKEATPEKLLELDHLTLAEGRGKATEWLRMIGRGIDPAGDLARRQRAKIEARKNTFAAVFEDWVREKLPTERKGAVVERDVRREFLPILGERPITEITDLDVLAIVNAKKHRSIRKKGGAPGQARNELGHVKRLFEWAVDQRVYGLKVNPCLSIKPSKILGKKRSGTRILNDDELLALWRATRRIGKTQVGAGIAATAPSPDSILRTARRKPDKPARRRRPAQAVVEAALIDLWPHENHGH